MLASRNDKVAPTEKGTTADSINMSTFPSPHKFIINNNNNNKNGSSNIATAVPSNNNQQQHHSHPHHHYYPATDRQQHHGRTRKRTMTVDGHGKLVRDHGLSYWATLVNFLKSLVGAGFLSLPLAFRDAGLWTALLLIVVFAFLNCLCMMQLVKCAQHQYRKLTIYYLNYGDLATHTCATSFAWIRPFKNWAKYIINLAILFLQFGFCSTYYLFIAVSLKEIAEELIQFRASILEWLLIIYLPMCLLNFIRTLRFLAIFSSIGNAFMLFSLVFILQFVIRNQSHSIATLPWYNNFDGLLTASGAIIYSFEAQTIVLPMENKLKRPAHMLGPFGVLSSGIFLASLIYSSIGFFGYAAYGHEVKGSITLNLPEHQVLFTLVKLAICVSVFASFLLQMYVIMEMLWNGICETIIDDADDAMVDIMDGAAGKQGGETNIETVKEQNGGGGGHWRHFRRLPASCRLGMELLFRILLVTICFLFAAAVPNLERIIPLVGITSGMLLSFVIPALLDLLTFVPVLIAKGRFWAARYRLVQNLLLACVGIFGMVAGLRTNIREMMADAGNGGGGTLAHISNNDTTTIITH